jgi:hypothetical protein
LAPLKDYCSNHPDIRLSFLDQLRRNMFSGSRIIEGKNRNRLLFHPTDRCKKVACTSLSCEYSLKLNCNYYY